MRRRQSILNTQPHRRGIARCALTAVALVAGCSQSTTNDETAIPRVFVKPAAIAVAPILNFSGEFSLDPIAAADLLASELTYVEGVTVLPVNRVIAVLAAQGKMQVESPAHALAVCDAVGADAILVAGITEYDAYTPTIGLVLQLYTSRPTPVEAFEPLLAARMAEPFEVTRMADPMLPSSQVQIVQNAAHASVQKAVKKYADPRDEAKTHLGWRSYLKVQSLFLRFCWNDAIHRLMKQERSRSALSGYALAGSGTEDPR